MIDFTGTLPFILSIHPPPFSSFSFSFSLLFQIQRDFRSMKRSERLEVSKVGVSLAKKHVYPQDYNSLFPLRNTERKRERERERVLGEDRE